MAAGPIRIDDGKTIRKAATAVQLYEFDWGSRHLLEGVTISTSTWTIEAIEPVNDTSLTYDQSTLGDELRTTQARFSGGKVGGSYKVTNTIGTNESPAQTLVAHTVLRII